MKNEKRRKMKDERWERAGTRLLGGWGGKVRVEVELDDVAGGNEFARIADLFPGAGAIDGRWPADDFVEQSAEGAETLKADGEADFGDGQVARGEELFGFIDALAHQILMGCFVIGLVEGAEEMKTGEMRRTRHRIEIERLVELRVDQFANALERGIGHGDNIARMGK